MLRHITVSTSNEVPVVRWTDFEKKEDLNLCRCCKKYIPEDFDWNCDVAQEVMEFCHKHKVELVVVECPTDRFDFVE